MFRGRPVLALIAALLAVFYVAGSSTASLACIFAGTQVASQPMKPGCPDMGKSPGGVTACAAMCVAVTPPVVEVPARAPVVAARAVVSPPPAPSRRIGPEPPPPRFG
jgi:hypothetical protein